MLKELIKINSITGNEKEIQGYILDLLASFGLKPLNVKGNVVVVIEGVDHSKCLIFNSHTDTVSLGEIKQWKKNPFEGYGANGKIYGLGSSDNKASVAVLLYLAKEFTIEKPECDIFLTFTVGEEVDGHGTDDTVKWLAANILKRYKSISAIVCEPTGLGCIGLAHKGNLFLKVVTFGRSGHGSKPIDNGDHAVLKMYEVVSKLDNLRRTWKKKYKNQILGSPTIGLITSITAGNEATPNKFPDSCSATFDIRTIPEMHSVAFDQVKKVVGKIGEIEYLYSPVPFGFTEKDSKIAKVFKDVTKLKFIAFPGSTDMPFFTQKGIPTVIFGPGEMDQMHKANEFCYSDKVGKCMEIFKMVIKGYNNLNEEDI